MSYILKEITLTLITYTSGFFSLFFFFFCSFFIFFFLSRALVIIHKRNQPNLAIYQRGKSKTLRIWLYLLARGEVLPLCGQKTKSSSNHTKKISAKYTHTHTKIIGYLGVFFFFFFNLPYFRLQVLVSCQTIAEF